MKTITITINLPYPDLSEKLRALADKDQKTLPAYIGMVLQDHVNKPAAKKQSKDKSKNGHEVQDFVDVILDQYIEAYQEVNKTQYIVVAKGIDRSAMGAIIKIYAKKYPDRNKEMCMNDLKAFFVKCLTINDPWYRDNMSPALIRSHFNQITKILLHGKSNLPSKPSKVENVKNIYTNIMRKIDNGEFNAISNE